MGHGMLGGINSRCVTFIYAAFIQLCEAVIVCLSKIPVGPNIKDEQPIERQK